MKAKLFILALLFAGLSFSNIQAQSTPKVKKRQINQQKRIHKGVESGELTKGEYVSLQKQQKQLNRNKKRAKADGVVTKRERRRLHAQQSRNSANIAKKKHNKRKRN